MFVQVTCIDFMKTFKERCAWAISSCRKARMRLTPAREAILSFLAQQRTPASLEMVSQADGVRGRCDATTVYRTLMLFKEAELVRVVGTPRKASYFVLNAPGDSVHFLICHDCGCVSNCRCLVPFRLKSGASLPRAVFHQSRRIVKFKASVRIVRPRTKLKSCHRN